MKTLLSLFALLVLAGCASRVPPSGGDVDKEPPQIVSQVPATGSILFAGDRIDLSFNEYVELKDGGTGVLISPPMAVTPEYILKGKNLSIRFKETLDTNTTYTLTLGKSITDLTEGNSLVEYPVVFSTGAVLDSFQVSGSVQDAYTNGVMKDVVVMMYPTAVDSLPFTTLPRYFARTNESGVYTVKNIKPGAYRILAVQDGNSDYKVTLPDEKIGFQADLTNLEKPLTPLAPFRLFTARPNKQRLVKKKYENPGKFTVKYAVAPEAWNLSVLGAESSKTLQYNFKPGMDSLLVWVPGKPVDTLKVLSESRIGDDTRLDTLIFTPKRISEMRGKGSKRSTPDTTLLLTSGNQGSKVRRGDSLSITLSAPALQEDATKMKIQFATDTLESNAGSWSGDRMRFTLALPVKSESFTVVFYPGAFTDIFDRKNDTLRVNLSWYGEDELGNFEFRFKNDSLQGSFVLEMLDKGGRIISRKNVKGSETIQYPLLAPGSYSMRLIEDTNGDGLWTTGDLAKRTQPERMLYFTEEIKLRAGWDLDLEWNIGQVNAPVKKGSVSK